MNIKGLKLIINKIITLDWSYTSKEYLEQLSTDSELKWADETLKSIGRFATGEDLNKRKTAIQILNSRGIKFCD